MTFDTAFERSHEPNYRKPHVFDPIHSGADECECGLTQDADIHESDEAYEDRMRPRIANAPERIWLQTGCDDEVGETDWKELAHEEVSWCAERIDNTDIAYIRADLPATKVAEARKEAFKEAIAAVMKHGEIIHRGNLIARLERAAATDNDKGPHPMSTDEYAAALDDDDD